MRGPKPPAVTLTTAARRDLEALAGAHRTPQQVALRARIVLAAADGANNAEIARRLGVEADTARQWRMRWLGLAALPLDDVSVAERLADAPRPGGPCRITAEQVCRLTELAEEAVQRGIVGQLSPRHAQRLLKRGICNPIVAATG